MTPETKNAPIAPEAPEAPAMPEQGTFGEEGQYGYQLHPQSGHVTYYEKNEAGVYKLVRDPAAQETVRTAHEIANLTTAFAEQDEQTRIEFRQKFIDAVGGNREAERVDFWEDARKW